MRLDNLNEEQLQSARVAFLSLDDSAEPNLLSGGFYSMRNGFKQIGCEVIDIFPVKPRTKARWLLKKVLQRLRGKFYHWDREPEFLRAVSRIAAERIKKSKPDLVIAVQSQTCAYLEVDVPIVLTHDQPFVELQDYFPFEKRPRTAEYVRQASEQEGRAFHAADLISFPSERACRTVETFYGVAPDKLRMVPWGGNLPRSPDRAEVNRMIEARRNGPIILTTIGVHWKRKGGDLVVSAYKALKEMGADVRLNIIGMSPPLAVDESVRVISFIDKSDAEQARGFEKILAETHFLVAPSRVEAFGHIFGEAAAFGVPSIASDVGGIPTSIKDGLNGRLLSLEASGEDYARVIYECHRSRQSYEAMAYASRLRFEQDLNWPAFCQRIVDEVVLLKNLKFADNR